MHWGQGQWALFWPWHSYGVHCRLGAGSSPSQGIHTSYHFSQLVNHLTDLHRGATHFFICFGERKVGMITSLENFCYLLLLHTSVIISSTKPHRNCEAFPRSPDIIWKQSAAFLHFRGGPAQPSIAGDVTSLLFKTPRGSISPTWPAQDPAGGGTAPKNRASKSIFSASC